MWNLCYFKIFFKILDLHQIRKCLQLIKLRPLIVFFLFLICRYFFKCLKKFLNIKENIKRTFTICRVIVPNGILKLANHMDTIWLFEVSQLSFILKRYIYRWKQDTFDALNHVFWVHTWTLWRLKISEEGIRKINSI